MKTVPSIFILAAGEDNSSLLSLSKNSSLLDWQVRAFKKINPENDPFVVVGHNFIRIIRDTDQMLKSMQARF